MKFEDKSNPYFGGGKMTMSEWVKKDIDSMPNEMEKVEFEGGDHYGVGVRKIYNITIAGGGPSMDIDIDTQNGEIYGGRYNYGWWGDNESVELSESEADTVAEYYGITGMIEDEKEEEGK